MDVRVYGKGDQCDEGGHFEVVKKSAPAWVSKAMKHCAGCRNDFYNGRANMGNINWCFSLKASYATRKTRPPCYHG